MPTPTRVDWSMLIRTPHAWLAALLVTALLFGCPKTPQSPDTLPLVTTDNPAAEQDMNAARDAEASGDFGKAETLYVNFLRKWPNDPLAVVARLGLGKVRLAAGKAQEARPLFLEVAKHEDASVRERGNFYLGVTAQLLGRPKEAVAKLAPMRGTTVDPTETALLFETLAAAYAQMGDRLAAVRMLDEMTRATVPEEDRKTARSRLTRIIENEVTKGEATELASSLQRDGLAWRLSALRVVREADRSGDLAAAKTYIDALKEQDVPLDDELNALAVRAEQSGAADTKAIGAILPLTGRGREVGQLALRGLMLATGTPPTAQHTKDAPQIVFRDSAADPQSAAKAVDDLYSLHRVAAIIGPVSGSAALAAATRAQELGVPLIALTPSPTITQERSMVFRLFPTAEEEVAALVKAAMAQGRSRFAVLASDHAYATKMSALFQKEVERHGKTVVLTVKYPAAATSFGEQMTQLSAPDVDFDALFVPDTANRIALIAPSLAAVGLWSSAASLPKKGSARAISLLAPSVAYDPKVLKNSKRYLQGTLFATSYSASQSPEAQAFAKAFSDKYASQPDRYAAAAYDAYKLIEAITQSSPNISRSELATALQAPRTTIGAAGGFSKQRTPTRATHVMQMSDGTLMPMTPRAPQAPTTP